MTILAYDARRLQSQAPSPRRWRPDWRRVVVCVCLAYAVVIGVRQALVYERLQAQIHSASLELAAVRRRDAALEQQVAFARSSTYVREAAQSELGLVPSGEMSFQPQSS